MDNKVKLANSLIRAYKGKNFSFGSGCLPDIAGFVNEFGSEILLIISQNKWAQPLRDSIKQLFEKSKIAIMAETGSAGENTPMEDVFALADLIRSVKPGCIVCVGGGSAIDCAKAANILASINYNDRQLEDFYGVGKVSEALAKNEGQKLYPLIAVETSAGSGSHITRYSNVTDMAAGQKKLIVDEVIIPDRAVFDYIITQTEPENLTKDGAMDGFSHCLEVYYGISEKAPNFKLVEEICLTGIELIIENLPMLLKDPNNSGLREKIGLATDLGAYAINILGTNGAHLNSFSFTKILTHGKACAILNPYYTVFFAPAIENKLRKIAGIYKKYISEDVSTLRGKEAGIAVARAMTDFSAVINFPESLGKITGFNDSYIEKALSAAKTPQLKSKLENMPVPLKQEQVEEYMRPVLEAAKTGDFSMIKEMR